jgi:hypothetical protein
MSTVNASVTPGYELTADVDGKVLLTKDRVNMIGRPVVSVELTGAVEEEDLAPGAVGAVALSDAVQAAICAGSQAVVGSSVAKTNPITVLLQVKDVAGDNAAGRFPVEWWVSNNDLPAGSTNEILPCSTKPDQTETYTYGVPVRKLANSATALSVTDEQGRLKVSLQHNAGAKTCYFHAWVGGRYYRGSTGIVWTS